MKLLVFLLLIHCGSVKGFIETSEVVQKYFTGSNNVAYRQFCKLGCAGYGRWDEFGCLTLSWEMISNLDENPALSFSSPVFNKLFWNATFCTQADSLSRIEYLIREESFLPVHLWCGLECLQKSRQERTSGLCSKIFREMRIGKEGSINGIDVFQANEMQYCPKGIRPIFRYHRFREVPLFIEMCPLHCQLSECPEKYHKLKELLWSPWYDESRFYSLLNDPKISFEELPSSPSLTNRSLTIQNSVQYLKWCQGGCSQYTGGYAQAKMCWQLLNSIREIYPSSSDSVEHSSFASLLYGQDMCDRVLSSTNASPLPKSIPVGPN